MQLFELYPPVRITLFHIFLSLFILLNASVVLSVETTPKKVLVLHSYHKGLSWTDSLAQGIDDTLVASGVSVDVSHDFMDTKRLFTENYLDQLVQIYDEKYGATEIDVIITTDDHAFQFLLKNQAQLFPNSPVVFCGVNNFKPEMIEGGRSFTGVVERFDIKGTLELARRLHPGVKRFVAISDQSLTGRTNSRLFKQAVKEVGPDLELLLLDNHSIEEVREQVAALTEKDVAFWLTFTSDRLGRYFSFRQSATQISEVSKVPLYSFWDFHLGFGTTGGLLTSGYFQGKTAADLATRILQGEDVSLVPVVTESPNRYMFDYNQLLRFDIDTSLLPADSVLINKPFSLYSQHKALVWSLLAGFCALATIIFLLLLNIMSRRRANIEIRKGKDRFQHIFNDAAVALFELDFSVACQNFKEICDNCEEKEFDDVMQVLRSDCSSLLPQVKLLDCNHAAVLLYGANNKDEIFEAGVAGLKLISMDTFVKLLHTMIRGSERVEWEGRGLTLNNVELHLLKNMQQFESPELMADFSSVIISVVDITERQRYLSELRVSEDRFRTLFNNAASGIALCDSNGNYLRVNRAFSKMLGYKESEMVGKNWRDITHKDSYSSTNSVIKSLLKQEQANSIEKQYLHKDGSIVWALLTVGLQKHEADAEKFFITQVQDITQMKAVQQKMRLREQKYKQIFEADLSGFYIANPNGEISLCNKVFAEILGLESDDAIMGRSIVPFHRTTSAWPSMLAILQDGGRVENLEVELIKEDGSPANAVCNAIGRVDSKGQLLEIQGHIVDITRQKKLEDKLFRAQKMEAIGLMAGGVAHDLNNILSGIVSYPDLMLAKLTEESSLRKPLMSMKESGTRAAAVVADLLTVARGAANVREIHSLKVLVTEYLKTPECKNLRTLYPDIEIVQEISAENGTILCSPVHIKKCLMNLVTNAAEAIEGAGKIVIGICEQTLTENAEEEISSRKYVTLSVKDNGTGISEKDRLRIFEPFYTKKVMGRSGTGLGLAVVWNTIQDHEGRIEVNTGEEGTTFTLFFPRFEKIEEQVVGDIEPIVFKGDGQRILIVDDEPMLREIAKEILVSLNYQVEIAESGEQALEFLQQDQVDLVLLDMFMEPGINGCQTYEHIKEIYPEQKALIASGFSKSDDVKRALKLGVGGFIEKPYSLNQLGRAVAKILQPANGV